MMVHRTKTCILASVADSSLFNVPNQGYNPGGFCTVLLSLMLTSTFLLLKGIGAGTERRLWQDGVLAWSEFLRRRDLPGISADRKTWYDESLTAAQDHLERRDYRYFASCLKMRDHWRLYETLRGRAVCLDIETTGAPVGNGHITVVGLHRGGRTRHLIHGINLNEDNLASELEQTDLLITFFGSGFDVPYLRATFPRLDWAKPHLDLCLAARQLGFHGGLKNIEVDLGITRDPSLQGLDGWDAVRLWHRWRAGSEASLELLLRYNAADACNLGPLADLIVDQMAARFGPASAAVGCAPARDAV